MTAAARMVVGLEGPDLTDAERAFLARGAAFGVVLFARNLENPEQAARLCAEVRALATPAPLLFVDQEGGTVDRIGPLLGVKFPSPAKASIAGLDRVHECAYLMGRAARLLGIDVDLAPVVDIGQPGAGAEVMPGRAFGFFQEDIIASGMVFLHGLTRAGVASCLKHFPGLGRGTVDAHRGLPVVDAHDVDLLVNDVAPFEKLARSADLVMVGHGSYPGLGDAAPASQSPTILRILRERLGTDIVTISDDLRMGALEGPLPERVRRAAEAGCDLVCLTPNSEVWDECVAAIAGEDDPAREARLNALRGRCSDAPRTVFTLEAWSRLEEEAKAFVELMEQPRKRSVASEE